VSRDNNRFLTSAVILAALLEKTQLDATTAATAEKNAATAEKTVEAAAKKAEKDAAIAKEKAAKVSLTFCLLY
jgi:hypothetical protein